jgi:predicted ATPase
MLVALSGAQGSGKSTVLNKLKSLGCNVIERKTGRSILTEWDVTLDQVYADADLTIKFQNEFLTRKLNDEAEARQSSLLWFTERSFADVFAYPLIVLGKNNANSDWLDNYYDQCAAANAGYIAVFYLQPFTQGNREDDGVRGTNKHYGNLVDMVIFNYLQKMSYVDSTEQYKFESISTPKVDDRTWQVLRAANDLWLNKVLK